MIKFTLFACIAVFPFSANPWGFEAHRTINYAAVFTLPPEMFLWYKQHIDLVKEGAVKADMRRYIQADEGIRHYLDVDFYENQSPIDTLPTNWYTAVEKYGEEVMLSHGILPWNLLRVLGQLTNAFAGHDNQAILRLSADLGHYVGDLHVPLHTTSNYNGQLTDQHGIHGLWESRLVELKSADYDLLVGTAHYIPNPAALIWQVLAESFAARDSVLELELEATKMVGEQNKYTFEERKGVVVKTYSRRFCQVYHHLLNGMVERRLRSSVHVLGCLWMTAWVNAGQPLIDGKPIGVEDDTLSNRLLTNPMLLQGKMLGREE